jgi:amino acid transporter
VVSRLPTVVLLRWRRSEQTTSIPAVDKVVTQRRPLCRSRRTTPRHAIEADLQDKGLSHGAVGLTSSVVLGISSVAPAYTLTATIGLLVAAVTLKTPAIFIAGFVPMFLTAYAYRELNKVAPDSGTSFTWATKAFGPYVGWMTGWGSIVATVIVLSSLSGVAVEFFYLFIAEVSGNDSIIDLASNRFVNIVTVIAFIGLATFVAYRGITTTEHVQVVLVAFQMGVLTLYVMMAFAKITSGDAPGDLSFSFDWLNPLTGLTVSAFVAGLTGSIFAFWGWDTCLTVNDESKDSDKVPGRAALLTVVIILLTYLLVAIASLMYAGIGTEGIGLGNEETSDNVFGALAEPILGSPWDLLLLLAVLASSAASLQTTFLPRSRTMLAMGVYQAIPRRSAAVHPRFLIPPFATLTAGVGTAIFYTFATLFTESVPTDTVAALGIMICFYYGLTAVTCTWYFRKELFIDAKSTLFKLVCPVLGGLGLAAVFVISVRDSYSDPEYGSGATVGGVNLVFVLAVGVLVLAVVLMFIQPAKDAAFFRGETLRRTLRRS